MEERESSRVYLLNKADMNVHRFNTTDSSVAHTLHINIRLTPVLLAGRAFPIAVLIRCVTSLSSQSPSSSGA